MKCLRIITPLLLLAALAACSAPRSGSPSVTTVHSTLDVSAIGLATVRWEYWKTVSTDSTSSPQ